MSIHFASPLPEIKMTLNPPVRGLLHRRTQNHVLTNVIFPKLTLHAKVVSICEELLGQTWPLLANFSHFLGTICWHDLEKNRRINKERGRSCEGERSHERDRERRREGGGEGRGKRERGERQRQRQRGRIVKERKRWERGNCIVSYLEFCIPALRSTERTLDLQNGVTISVFQWEPGKNERAVLKARKGVTQSKESVSIMVTGGNTHFFHLLTCSI